MEYYTRYSLTAALTTVIYTVFIIWFFKMYYCNDSPRELAYDQNGNRLKLRRVIMVFRHGMRSPTDALNFAEDKKPKHYPTGYGELTNEGKLQLYEMGKSMRRRYFDFITPHNIYMDADVRAVSTNIGRCLESAALILAGLYPPEGHQIWNRKLKWQPVPITSSSPDKAYVLIEGPTSCPVYYQQLNLTNFTSDVSDKLFGYFSPYVKELSLLQLFLACESIVSQTKINIPQPQWIRDIYSNSVIRFLTQSFCYIARNRRLQQFLSGQLLSDIVSQMKTVVSSSDFSKFYLYSGHDVSIVSLLHSLGFQSCILPEYGSAVIFELYSSPHGEEYYVKVLHSEDTSFLHIKTKLVPRCEQVLCPLDKFVDTVKPLFISEDKWKNDCNSM